LISFRNTTLEQLFASYRVGVDEFRGAARVTVPIRASAGREDFGPALALEPLRVRRRERAVRSAPHAIRAAHARVVDGAPVEGRSRPRDAAAVGPAVAAPRRDRDGIGRETRIEFPPIS
jgi:hypothetical protein